MGVMKPNPHFKILLERVPKAARLDWPERRHACRKDHRTLALRYHKFWIHQYMIAGPRRILAAARVLLVGRHRIPLPFSVFFSYLSLASIKPLQPSFASGKVAAFCASAASTWDSMEGKTGVDVQTPSGKKLHFVWLPEVSSTQDEMRALIRSELFASLESSADVVAIGAGSQTKGRGTSGRAWVGLSGNVFLTVAIRRDAVPYIPTLLPLRIGTIIAREVMARLPPTAPQVTLKWPNDVLIGEDKASGLLIESEGDRYLLGIGVNVAQAPEVPSEGVDRGRKATSLATHGFHTTPESSREVALSLASSITQWVGTRDDDRADKVVSDWGSLTDWSRAYTLRDTGAVVYPLGLEADGRLRIRDDTGKLNHLVAEYLY